MRTTEFKDTELGPIPKDWEVKRLGECCQKIGSGATPTGGASVYLQSGVSLIRSQNVYNGYFKYDGLAHISDEAASELDSVMVCKGDVLLNITGDSVARSTLVPCNVLPARVNQHVAIIRTKADELASEFLQCYLTMPTMQAFMLKVASGQGGSRNALTKGMVSDFQIPFPPLPEQRRIAAALGDVDKLIENLKKRVEKKKNLKRGAMQELLTGRRRLKGFAGAWVEKRLGDLLDYEQPQRYIVKSSDYCDSGIPVLTPGKSFILGYTTEMDGVCENLPVILFDDFLTISRYITFPFKVKSSAVKMLRLRNANDSMYFIQAAMESLGYVPGDHQRHWIGIFSKLTILMPECVEQRAIAAVLSDMDAEIANLEAKLKKMTLLKQGMMQDLLTGKVRLV